ncbi:MAG: heme ABC transporter ATP-binding protein CcmA, partial [Aestuariibacter sp.]|nr:heme ABC transporter ATP-binding protein CcmA [Aestuariibacter sp.]
AEQNRRLALERLLVTEAKLWMLDEPFTSLDKKSMANLQALFEGHMANKGMVVMTSHHEIVMPEPELKPLDVSA